MGYHKHRFKFDCKIAQGHDHRLMGYAGNKLGAGKWHIHFYYGVTSYRSHTHYFCGITGMPIKTENGHIHRMDGRLESNSLHTHEYCGYTSEDITTASSTQAAGFVR
jgi:hypothetical protein